MSALASMEEGRLCSCTDSEGQCHCREISGDETLCRKYTGL